MGAHHPVIQVSFNSEVMEYFEEDKKPDVGALELPTKEEIYKFEDKKPTMGTHHPVLQVSIKSEVNEYFEEDEKPDVGALQLPTKEEINFAEIDKFEENKPIMGAHHPVLQVSIKNEVKEYFEEDARPVFGALQLPTKEEINQEGC